MFVLEMCWTINLKIINICITRYIQGWWSERCLYLQPADVNQMFVLEIMNVFRAKSNLRRRLNFVHNLFSMNVN